MVQNAHLYFKIKKTIFFLLQIQGAFMNIKLK